MAYDSSKDKIIEDEVLENTNIHVRIVQYGDGDKKIAVLTEYDEDKFTTKLSRMTKPVAQALAETIQRLSAKL